MRDKITRKNKDILYDKDKKTPKDLNNQKSDRLLDVIPIKQEYNKDSF